MATKPQQTVQAAFTTTAQRIENSMASHVSKLESLIMDAKNIPSLITPIAEQIEDAQTQLSNLTSEYATKFRESEAELALKIKENKESVLDELLSEFNLAKISTSELSTLQDELQEAIDSKAEEVQEAVAKAMKSHAIELNTVKTTAEHNLQLALAKADARIENLEEKLSFYEEKAREDKEERALEREAAIAKEKAISSRQGANIYTNTK